MSELKIVLSETDKRDKFAAIAQSLLRIAYGFSLLLHNPAGAALFRRLMVAVVDARRSFRFVTLLALRSALQLRSVRGEMSPPQQLEGCCHLAKCCGMSCDVQAWLQQHGALRGGYQANAKAADWWWAVSLSFDLLARRVRDGAREALTVSIREILLLIQIWHDLLGQPLRAASHEAVRQLCVGLCGLTTNTQDLIGMVRAARARQELGLW